MSTEEHRTLLDKLEQIEARIRRLEIIGAFVAGIIGAMNGVRLFL